MGGPANDICMIFLRLIWFTFAVASENAPAHFVKTGYKARIRWKTKLGKQKAFGWGWKWIFKI